MNALTLLWSLRGYGDADHVRRRRELITSLTDSDLTYAHQALSLPVLQPGPMLAEVEAELIRRGKLRVN